MRASSISHLLLTCSRVPLVALLLAGTALSSLAAAQTPEHVVRYSTRTTDLVGNPIDSVLVGEQFKLEVVVQDIRDPAPQESGVFSPIVKVQFDDSLTPARTPLQYLMDDYFDNLFWQVSVEPDAIFAYGSSSSPTPPGSAPQQFFNIVLEATNPGTQVFVPTYHQTLDAATYIFGFGDGLVNADQILYQGSTLLVVPEPSSVALSLIAAAALWPLMRRRKTRR